MTNGEIIKKAGKYMLENVPSSRKPNEEFYKHVLGCRKYALMLAKEYNEDGFVIETAALLHDLGESGPDHATEGARLANIFLKMNDVEIKIRKRIVACVKTHAIGYKTNNLESQIIQDADGLIFLEDTYKTFFNKRRGQGNLEELKKETVKKTKLMAEKIKTKKGLSIAKNLLPKALSWLESQK